MFSSPKCYKEGYQIHLGAADVERDNLEPDVGIELLTLIVTNCTGAAREKLFDHWEGASGKPFRGAGNISESRKK